MTGSLSFAETYPIILGIAVGGALPVLVIALLLGLTQLQAQENVKTQAAAVMPSGMDRREMDRITRQLLRRDRRRVC